MAILNRRRLLTIFFGLILCLGNSQTKRDTLYHHIIKDTIYLQESEDIEEVKEYAQKFKHNYSDTVLNSVESVLLVRLNTNYIEIIKRDNGRMDSVIQVAVDSDLKMDSRINLTEGRQLNKHQKSEIITLFKSPNNFSFSACGTFVPSHLFVFYNSSKKIVFTAAFGCGIAQVYTRPATEIIKYGGLKPSAAQKVQKIVRQIKFK